MFLFNFMEKSYVGIACYQINLCIKYLKINQLISRLNIFLDINFAEIYIIFNNNSFYLQNSIVEISLKEKNLIF